MIPRLPRSKFGVILADPPWKYGTWRGTRGTAEKYYPTMTPEQIAAIPIVTIAEDNCALFLWVTSLFLLEVVPIIKLWGFKYKTIAFWWEKMSKTGKKPHFGMGHWTRPDLEICLLATRGRPIRTSKNTRQRIIAPIREHSRKPDEQYECIENLVPGPYIELFARGPRKGWKTWGKESK